MPQGRSSQTLGYLDSVIASGFLLGPFVGRLAYHGGGYDAVFYVAYSSIAIDMGMRMAMVEKEGMFQILRQRRMLISSWALLVQGIFLSVFDAVRCNQSRAVNVGKTDKGPGTIHLR